MRQNILILMLLMLVSLFIGINYYDKKRDLIVENIRKGENKDSIIKKLGTPDEITFCSSHLWWDNECKEDINKTCKSYFIYKGLFLKRWGIGFDNNNTVITKYPYVSE